MDRSDDTVLRLSAARPDDSDAAHTHDHLRAALFGASPSEPEAAPLLGRYRLDERGGVGGMGVVFRGFDPALDRAVAVKLVRASAAEAELLATEARAQAKLEHPAVVPVHDIGSYGPSEVSADVAARWSVPRTGVFIVMQWVDGLTLDAWAREAPRPVEEQLRVFDAIARGLQHVHERGLVHRDFKPRNVIIDADTQPHVVDFGIAAFVATSDADAADGEVRGTPRYMAPEQHAGKPADPRSDQYSFAVCLLESLAGRRAFDTSIAGLARAKAAGEIDPEALAAVPRALRSALRRALDPSPEHRFESVAAMMAAIARARRTRRGVVYGSMGALLAAAAVVAWPTPSTVDPCIDAAAPLYEVWTPTREQRVAPEHQAQVRTFAARWSEARVGACRALLDSGTLAAAEGRVLCLDRALSTFEASMDLLESGLEEPRASTLVEALPSPERCSEPKAGRVALLLPTDAPGQATAEEAVAALDRAAASGIAGELDTQLEQAERAHALALTVEHPPLRAAAAHRLAWALWETNEAEAALPFFERALRDAELAGDIDRAVRIQTDMVGMLGASLGRYDEALGLAMALDARCEAVADPRRCRAGVRHNVGRTKLSRGDIEGALPDLARALAHRRALGDDGPGYASNVSLLGHAYQRLNRLDEALESYEAAYDWHARRAPEHPGTATALNNLAIVLQRLGRHDEARERYEQALERFEATRGMQSRDTGMVLNNLGVLHYLRGDMQASEDAQRRAIEAKLASVGASHPDLGYSWVNLGRVLIKQGALNDAEDAFVRAHDNWADALGEKHPLLAEPALGRAETALASGDPEDAARLLAQAQTLASLGSGEDPEQRARMLTVEAALAEPERAEAAASEALRAWQAVSGPSFDRQEHERWMLARGYSVPSSPRHDRLTR